MNLKEMAIQVVLFHLIGEVGLFLRSSVHSLTFCFLEKNKRKSLRTGSKFGTGAQCISKKYIDF